MSNTLRATSPQSESLALGKPPFENMVWIPGGTFLMGSDKHYPEEAPAHEVTVDGFWIDQHTVTNEEFPPRQKAASFTIDQVMEQLSQPATGAG